MKLKLRRTSHLMIVLLAGGTLVRCDCEEQNPFLPGASYEPEEVLDFGPVAVTGEKTLDIEVLSNGRAALILTQLDFPGADAGKLSKFLFEGMACQAGAACTNIKDILKTGLGPSRTSSITITYRPCPDAWNNNMLKEGYDFSTCPDAADQVTMKIIDNTPSGEATIVLNGQPAQAPVLELACPPPGQQCNNTDPMFVTPCVTLNFGNVTAGGQACEILVEVRNKERNGKPTGTLNLSKMDILVQEINAGTIVNGETVGFKLLDVSGMRLAPDQTAPFQVPFPRGAMLGSQRFKVSFDGSGFGIWRGESGRMTGLRIYNDDPNKQPFTTISVSGTGSAPNLQCNPTRIDYGPVEQNRTRTATINCSNAGDSDLMISDIRFAQDMTMSELMFRTDRGQNFPITITPFNNNRIAIYVSYTPRDSGTDDDVLRIGSNDINNNPLDIPITGGAVPRISCSPVDAVYFPLPNPRPPPPLPRQCQNVRCSNVGFGDLTIQRFSMTGPEGIPDHPSLDDFSVTQCPAGLPCSPNPAVTLCPPTNPTCTNSSTDIEICYQNDDNSVQDLAEFKIDSTDLANPTVLLTLNAEDVPCLFPSPVIEVETPQPVEGMEVCVNGLMSDPGGDPGNPAMITRYEWRFAFTPCGTPLFVPAEAARVCFTPLCSGLHVIELDVTNSCGRKSQSPAQENILVRMSGS